MVSLMPSSICGLGGSNALSGGEQLALAMQSDQLYKDIDTSQGLGTGFFQPRSVNSARTRMPTEDGRVGHRDALESRNSLEFKQRDASVGTGVFMPKTFRNEAPKKQQKLSEMSTLQQLQKPFASVGSLQAQHTADISLDNAWSKGARGMETALCRMRYPAAAGVVPARPGRRSLELNDSRLTGMSMRDEFSMPMQHSVIKSPSVPAVNEQANNDWTADGGVSDALLQRAAWCSTSSAFVPASQQKLKHLSPFAAHRASEPVLEDGLCFDSLSPSSGMSDSTLHADAAAYHGMAMGMVGRTHALQRSYASDDFSQHLEFNSAFCRPQRYDSCPAAMPRAALQPALSMPHGFEMWGSTAAAGMAGWGVESPTRSVSSSLTDNLRVPCTAGFAANAQVRMDPDSPFTREHVSLLASLTRCSSSDVFSLSSPCSSLHSPQHACDSRMHSPAVAEQDDMQMAELLAMGLSDVLEEAMGQEEFHRACSW